MVPRGEDRGPGALVRQSQINRSPPPSYSSWEGTSRCSTVNFGKLRVLLGACVHRVWAALL